jgi:hypothetical protein
MTFPRVGHYCAPISMAPDVAIQPSSGERTTLTVLRREPLGNPSASDERNRPPRADRPEIDGYQSSVG